MNIHLSISLLLIPFLTFSQKKEIDSLHKRLPSLQDSSRIDCLNAISYQYQQNLSNRDSAQFYSQLAYQEADRLQYIHGMAESVSNQAAILFNFDSDFGQSEILAKKAVDLFSKTANKRGLESIYEILTDDVFAESKYDEAYFYTQKKYQLCLIRDDKIGMYYCLSGFGVIHFQKGNYDSSFYYMHLAQQIASISENKYASSNIQFLFGTLYRAIGNYPEALGMYRQVFEHDDPEIKKERIKGENWEAWVRMEYAELFGLQNQFDSAWHYYNLLDTSRLADRFLRIYLVSTGETYLLQRLYSKALPNFIRGLRMHLKLNDQNEVKRTFLDLAKTYYHLYKNDSALKYARMGLNLAILTKSYQFVRDGYQILFSVYDRTGPVDSAYFYFRKFNEIRDVIVSDQTKGKLAAFTYEEKIKLLSNEKKLGQRELSFQQQKLNTESRIKNILIIGIVILFILGFFIFRTFSLRNKNEKLESERSRLELQRKSVDLEMQALRAQMSPHFIFNCLNSINRFILKNESEAASDYLTKFSRLIRMVLVNSKNKLISLEEELAMLKLYLDMERLRFKDSFEYKIECQEIGEAENLFVPPLLIQPFAENAIWHGLMNKNEAGELNISFRLENQKLLICTVSDNGIGREAASILKSKSAQKQKSMGLQITKERLDLLNTNEDVQTSFVTEDMFDEEGKAAGTKVILIICVKRNSES